MSATAWMGAAGLGILVEIGFIIHNLVVMLF